GRSSPTSAGARPAVRSPAFRGRPPCGPAWWCRRGVGLAGGPSVSLHEDRADLVTAGVELPGPAACDDVGAARVPGGLPAGLDGEVDAVAEAPVGAEARRLRCGR